jgi:hypothetical protein
MLVFRILVIIGLIAVAVSMGVYFLSGNKRYIRFSWQLIKFTIVLLFVAAALIAMGRIILF